MSEQLVSKLWKQALLRADSIHFVLWCWKFQN